MTGSTTTIKTPPKLFNHRYRIIRPLASGGFGQTFLAEDTQMPSSRYCVIKRLKPYSDTPQMRQIVRDRFRREATILERLGNGSDRIPQLHAYFERGGKFYLVQEWIQGETLLDRVKQYGLFGEGEVRAILMKILPVLDYVHQQGIIHRDIKPDNIMWRHNDRQPVLIDFGAVKETMGTTIDSQGKAVASIVIGSSGFMASEQASGRPTFSSDIYSLGMTAIFLLTGKSPQELGTDPETGEILWRQYAEGISPKFAAVLDKAIKFHPRDRFATAIQMQKALQSCSRALPPTKLSLPLPTMYGERLNKETPRKNWKGWQKAVAVGMAIGAMVGAAVGFGNKLAFSEEVEPQKSATAKCEGLGVTPEQFYFLGDSAFFNPDTAKEKCQSLVESGETEAGVFWSNNYANMHGDAVYKVYGGIFSDRSSCQKALVEFSQKNPDAYCGFASKQK